MSLGRIIGNTIEETSDDVVKVATKGAGRAQRRRAARSNEILDRLVTKTKSGTYNKNSEKTFMKNIMEKEAKDLTDDELQLLIESYELKGTKKNPITRDNIEAKIQEQLERAAKEQEVIRQNMMDIEDKKNWESINKEPKPEKKPQGPPTRDEALNAAYGDNRNVSREEYKAARRAARGVKDKDGNVVQEAVSAEEAVKIGKNHNKETWEEKVIKDPTSLIGKNSRKNLSKFWSDTGETGTKFREALIDAAIADSDLLFKLDADDKVITDVYKHINGDDFINQATKKKFEAGKFDKKYGFGGSWDDLTDVQKSALIDDFKSNELKNFNDTFSGETTSGWGPWKKTELNGEFDLKASRQRYIRDKLGFDPSKKTYNKNWNRLFDEEDGAKLTGAYRDYYNKAKSIYDSGSTTVLPNAEDFLKKEKGLSVKQIENIMNGLGHHGIDSASKHTGLKVAAGIAGGTVALWALSEVYDE